MAVILTYMYTRLESNNNELQGQLVSLYWQLLVLCQESNNNELQAGARPAWHPDGVHAALTIKELQVNWLIIQSTTDRAIDAHHQRIATFHSSLYVMC